MRYKCLACVVACGLICGNAQAEGARVGMEYESEKDLRTGIVNHALSVSPGWQFAENNLINRAELLLEHNQDDRADNSGVRASENKFFVRLQHSGKVTEHLGYSLRGGLGRHFGGQEGISFGYLEQGIKFEFAPRWVWVAAFRQINSVDGTNGERVRKFITGPSFDLDKSNEIEFRYYHGRGDKDLRAWALEYVHKY